MTTPAAESTPGGLTRNQNVGVAGVTIALAILVYLPILWFMIQHWGAVDDYSHGFLIVPLAIYFAYQQRDQLKAAPVEGSWWGLLPLILGALSLSIGRLGVELMSMRAAFVLTIIGLVLLLLGKQIFRILAFPLCFLFLMVPLPQSLVNVIAFPLQLVAAQIAVSALHWIGIPALLEGNIIHLADTELFVAEACSGLRSLMALLTLGVVFAYFLERGIIRRAIIIVSTVPIAIGVNAFRVTLTGILAQTYGEAAAGGFIHDFQGIITFLLAFAVLLAEAKVIEFIARPRKDLTESTS